MRFSVCVPGSTKHDILMYRHTHNSQMLAGLLLAGGGCDPRRRPWSPVPGGACDSCGRLGPLARTFQGLGLVFRVLGLGLGLVFRVLGLGFRVRVGVRISFLQGVGNGLRGAWIEAGRGYLLLFLAASAP